MIPEEEKDVMDGARSQVQRKLVQARVCVWVPKGGKSGEETVAKTKTEVDNGRQGENDCCRVRHCVRV